MTRIGYECGRVREGRREEGEGASVTRMRVWPRDSDASVAAPSMFSEDLFNSRKLAPDDGDDE